jgi:hypothetical protein
LPHLRYRRSPRRKTQRARKVCTTERWTSLKTVDEDISGADIAGNPYKYEGDNVELHCAIASIPSSDFFNASCGTQADGTPAIIVVEAPGYDITSMTKGESIRILGTVQSPTQGTNGFGAQENFPTVSIVYADCDQGCD